MKIDQNVLFTKTLVDASPVGVSKDAAKLPPVLVRPTVPAEQGPPASVAPELPSTQGNFDAVRVSRIRDDISAGLYQVNTEKIADGLLASVRDLIGRKVS